MAAARLPLLELLSSPMNTRPPSWLSHMQQSGHAGHPSPLMRLLSRAPPAFQPEQQRVIREPLEQAVDGRVAGGQSRASLGGHGASALLQHLQGFRYKVEGSNPDPQSIPFVAAPAMKGIHPHRDIPDPPAISYGCSSNTR